MLLTAKHELFDQIGTKGGWNVSTTGGDITTTTYKEKSISSSRPDKLRWSIIIWTENVYDYGT